jgi:hypothetical protein
MFEEIGMRIDNPGAEVGRRVTTFRRIDGELLEADERFFLVRIRHHVQLSDERWTDLEREVVRGSRWWSQRDLIATDEQVFPEDLADMLAEAGVW